MKKSKKYVDLIHFSYSHLQPPLRGVSEQFSNLAYQMTELLPRNKEAKRFLKVLLRAKDHAVRAQVMGMKKMLILNGIEKLFEGNRIPYSEIAEMSNKRGVCTITYENALEGGVLKEGDSVRIIGKTIINCFTSI